ncbi:MAG: hypothetical protein V7K27_33805 [Nostoc sp.]
MSFVICHLSFVRNSPPAPPSPPSPSSPSSPPLPTPQQLSIALCKVFVTKCLNLSVITKLNK